MNVGLQPEVVVIDSDSVNLTLLTEFLVDYTPSSLSALSVDEPIGSVDINVVFEINQVSLLCIK